MISFVRREGFILAASMSCAVFLVRSLCGQLFLGSWPDQTPCKYSILLVGAPRFELGTPSPPDWCANRAALRSDGGKTAGAECAPVPSFMQMAEESNVSRLPA